MDKEIERIVLSKLARNALAGVPELRHVFAAAAGRPPTASQLRRVMPKRPSRHAPPHELPMMNYFNAVHFRLAAHLTLQAPRWRAREVKRIMARWEALSTDCSRPGAARSEMQKDAFDYANSLVRGRVASRLAKLESVRQSMRYDHLQFSDPLDVIMQVNPTQRRSAKLK